MQELPVIQFNTIQIQKYIPEEKIIYCMFTWRDANLQLCVS